MESWSYVIVSEITYKQDREKGGYIAEATARLQCSNNSTPQVPFKVSAHTEKAEGGEAALRICVEHELQRVIDDFERAKKDVRF